MPSADDPILRKTENIEGTRYAPAMRVQSFTVPTSDDPTFKRADYDLWVASEAFKILAEKYPGWMWKVTADSAQGYVFIQIPFLTNNWGFVIRWHDLTPQMVMRGGGTILERMRLPRSAIDVAALLASREKYGNFTAKKGLPE